MHSSPQIPQRFDQNWRAAAHSDDSSIIQRSPQSTAFFSPCPIRRWDSQLCYISTRTTKISWPRGTAAFRIYRQFMLRGGHFVSLVYRCHLSFHGFFVFKVAFYQHFLQCCKSCHSFIALLKKCLYLSFLHAAGILVSNDSYLVSILCFLHETSGTLIFLFYFF